MSRGKPKWQKHGHEARRLYVEESLSIRTISKRLKISERTLYRWRRDDDWEKRREEYQASLGRSISILQKKVIEVINKLDDADEARTISLADALSKLRKQLQDLQKQRDRYRETIDVMNEFVDWLDVENDEDKEILELLLRKWMRFVEHVVSQGN